MEFPIKLGTVMAGWFIVYIERVTGYNFQNISTVNVGNTACVVLLVFHTKMPAFYKYSESKLRFELCVFTGWQSLFENIFYIIEWLLMQLLC